MTAPNVDYLDADFDSYVQGLLDKLHVPGFAIAIVDGEQIKTKAYGLARFPDVPATPETLWFTGSTTKSMIAAVAGMLVHDPSMIKSDSKLKKVKWTTPLIDILGDDFQLHDPYMTANVTLEDALSHRSGLPGHDNCYGTWQGLTLRDLTKRLRYLGSEKLPIRTTFAYNNLMYAVAGDVIETLTGLDIGEALKKYLWQPLGMHNTFWSLHGYADAVSDKSDTRFSRGYYWFDTSKQADSNEKATIQDGGYYITDAYLDMRPISPAGATISTVDDYAKWMMALLKASKMSTDTANSPSNTVITPDLFKDVTTPRTIINPISNWHQHLAPLPENPQFVPDIYALGWMNNPRLYPGTNIIAHAGGTSSHGAECQMAPDLDFGVVTVGNTAGSSNVVGVSVVKELIGRRLGKSVEERRPPLPETDSKEKQLPIAGSETVVEGEIHKDLAAVVERPAPTSIVHEAEQARTRDSSASNFEQYTGTYSNQAYGNYSIKVIATGEPNLSNKSPTYNGERIVRPAEIPSTQKPLSSSSQTSIVLNAHPIGHRIWTATLLLHTGIASDISKSSLRPSKYQDLQFLTMEKLNNIGDLSYDPIPGYACGTGRSTYPEKCRYECRDQSVHMSTDKVPAGACFSIDYTGKTKLGLILVRQSLERIKEQAKEKRTSSKAGHATTDINEQEQEQEQELDPDWEDGMIWFEKL